MIDPHAASDLQTDSGVDDARLFQLTFDRAPVGIAHVSIAGRWLRVNARLCEILGFSREELLARNFQDMTHPDDRDVEPERLRALLLRDADAFDVEKRCLRSDGGTTWIRCNVSLVWTHDRQPGFFIFVIKDIQRRKEAEEAAMRMAQREIEARAAQEKARADQLARTAHDLFEQKEAIRTTLASIGDAVITTDVEGRVTFLNATAERLTGWADQEAMGQPTGIIFHIVNDQSGEPGDDPVRRALAEGRIVGLANHNVLVHRDGHRYAIEDSCAPVRDRHGQIIGCVLVFRDVTKARAQAHAIYHQATHDALTGLTNRREFERRLERVLAGTQAVSSVLLYLDLDQFKLVNDTCGHVAGDALLRQLATLLQSKVRHRDTFARLGGDEFAALLEHCDVDQGLRVAHALRDTLNAYRFRWGDQVFAVGASIGLVPLVGSDWTLSMALTAADSACYTAKERGRNRVHVYEVGDAEVARRRGEMGWISQIQSALSDDRLRLFFQPISPLHTDEKRLLHGEVLLRLIDDKGQLVLPKAFVPAVERYQQVNRLDRWVLQRLFEQLRRSPIAFKEHDCLISVNLSGQSLGNEEFHAFVLDELARAPIYPSSLCFEITETAAIGNLASALRFMDSLRQYGCRFALDDFGSGLSSFGYLKTLRVGFLKIDGSFVRDLLEDPLDLAMVQSVQRVAEVMGIETIGEWAESPAIVDKLRTIGVDHAQGFAVGHPRPFEDVLTGLHVH